MPSSWSERFGLSRESEAALDAALAALVAPDLGDDGAEDRRRIEDLLERLRDHNASLSWVEAPLGAAALARIAHSAPYLIRHLASDPKRVERGVLAELEHAAPPVWSDSQGGPFALLEEASALSALRRWKYDRFARLTARSLLGIADAAETCSAVAVVAEGVTRAAMAHTFASHVRRFGLPVCA